MQNYLFRRIPDGKAPRFPKKPTIRQEGDVLIMECLLEAHPYPDITWFQSEKSIADSPRVRMLRKTTSKDTYLLTLEISNPTREDGGHYRCNAFNEYGESNANIALNFQGMLSKKPYHQRIFLYSVSVKRLNSVIVLISVPYVPVPSFVHQQTVVSSTCFYCHFA